MATNLFQLDNLLIDHVVWQLEGAALTAHIEGPDCHGGPLARFRGMGVVNTPRTSAVGPSRRLTATLVMAAIGSRPDERRGSHT